MHTSWRVYTLSDGYETRCCITNECNRIANHKGLYKTWKAVHVEIVYAEVIPSDESTIQFSQPQYHQGSQISSQVLMDNHTLTATTLKEW